MVEVNRTVRTPDKRWYKTLGQLGSMSAVGEGAMWINILGEGMSRSGVVNLDEYSSYKPAKKSSWLLTRQPKRL